MGFGFKQSKYVRYLLKKYLGEGVIIALLNFLLFCFLLFLFCVELVNFCHSQKFVPIFKHQLVQVCQISGKYLFQVIDFNAYCFYIDLRISEKESHTITRLLYFYYLKCVKYIRGSAGLRLNPPVKMNEFVGDWCFVQEALFYQNFLHVNDSTFPTELNCIHILKHFNSSSQNSFVCVSQVNYLTYC